VPYYYVRLRKTEEHVGRLHADDLEHSGTGWQPVVPLGQGLLHGSLIDRTPGLRDTIKMLGLSISAHRPPGLGPELSRRLVGASTNT
jgi:hypothetical protein